MNDYIETTRRHWDELVPVHVSSAFYDVASFKAGRSTLTRIEREELGDVRGKTLLHLQCHFGLDTLSWAREGAAVTGVDFSAEAVRVARGLARELGIEAAFIKSDVYELPEALSGTFDIVFASYGVICWLPDFPRWAQIAESYVKPGGVFYLLDSHPAGNMLDDDAPEGLRLRYSYFPTETPLTFENEGSYADRSAKLQNDRTYEFTHGLGEIVTSLADAGLQIEFLHEFPHAGYPCLPQMQRGDDGFWRLPGNDGVPFLFSIKAQKPAEP
jgi:SAM-dependent methyltransferase